MNKVIEEIKQHGIIYIGLLLMLIVGIFLRTYHFADNIFIGIDQARDYRIIHDILEKGIEDFPLVGPKAGGTLFRLGPIFYAPALVSSLIFGLSVQSIVLPELLFSIFTIPLFYLFLREFFSKSISLSVGLVFSVSLFAVEYAHFTWNPNSVPFFMLVAFYALLRYSRADKNQNIWIILLAVATSISMQLHTITFIGMPLIIVLYFIFAKIKISIKQFIFSMMVGILLFSPLIFNDILTKGENTREFFSAVLENDDSDERTTVPKQVFVNVYNFTQFYTLILSSNDHINKPIRLESSQDLKELINKNISNSVLRNNILKASFISFLSLIILGLFLKIYVFKRKNNYFKTNIGKHNFILLVIIWQIVFFLLFYPLALKIDSRYFLVLLFVPFILLGFIFQIINIYFVKYGKIIIVIITMTLVVLNFYQSFRWLRLIDSYSEENFKIDEIILESYFVVTAKQWMDIIEKVESEFGEGIFSNIYIQAHPFYTKSLLYLPRINNNLPMAEIILEDLDASGLYFVLRDAEKLEEKGKVPEKFKKYFNIVEETKFGTVTLIQLELKNKNNSLPKERIQMKYERTNNRCYLTELDIEERDKCRVRDVKHIFY